MISNSHRTPWVSLLAAWLGFSVISACSIVRQPVAPSISPSPSVLELQPTITPLDSPTLQPTATESAFAEDTPTSLPTSTSTSTPGVTPSLHSIAEFPDPNGYVWRPVVEGLDKPVGLVNAGDNSERLFVLEQRGRIRIIQDSTLVTEPFLDIVERVRSSSSEQGLLGLAFHPRYLENGYFFVNYTDLNGDTVIARYRVSQADPDKAEFASEERLLLIGQPYPNHNGGGMAFGADGYLYLGLGDGGAANDPDGNAQSLTTHLGKLLRIQVDEASGYAIPEDNPFFRGEGLPEIWAYGLRNPWRFSFDRLTGDLYIADVGQNLWEEINYLPANSSPGVNFGWDYREGMHPFEGQIPAGVALVEPVAEYDHSLGCSVTGGFVYRGQALPAWQGVYLFGDYCTGLVWGLISSLDNAWPQQLLFETGANITAFGEDERGEIYLVDHNGSIYKLDQAGS